MAPIRIEDDAQISCDLTIRDISPYVARGEHVLEYTSKVNIAANADLVTER